MYRLHFCLRSLHFSYPVSCVSFSRSSSSSIATSSLSLYSRFTRFASSSSSRSPSSTVSRSPSSSVPPSSKLRELNYSPAQVKSVRSARKEAEEREKANAKPPEPTLPPEEQAIKDTCEDLGISREEFDRIAQSLKHGTAESYGVPNLSPAYFQRITAQHPKLEVKQSEVAGRGLFVRESVQAGEVIWEEEPFVSIPISIREGKPKPTITAARRTLQKRYQLKPELINRPFYLNAADEPEVKLASGDAFDKLRIPGQKSNTQDLEIYTIEDLGAIAQGKLPPSKVQQFLKVPEAPKPKEIEGAKAEESKEPNQVAKEATAASAPSTPSVPSDPDLDLLPLAVANVIPLLTGPSLHHSHSCSQCHRSLRLPVHVINRSGHLSSPYDSPLDENELRRKAVDFLRSQTGSAADCWISGPLKCSHQHCQAVFCSPECESAASSWHSVEHQVKDSLAKELPTFERVMRSCEAEDREPRLGESHLNDLQRLVSEIDDLPDHFFGIRDILFRTLSSLKGFYDSGADVRQGQNIVKDVCQLAFHEEMQESEKFAKLYRILFLGSDRPPIVFPEDFAEVAEDHLQVPLIFDYWLTKRGFRRLMAAVGINGFTPHVQTPRLLVGGVRMNRATASASSPEEVAAIDQVVLPKYAEALEISNPVAPTAPSSVSLRVPTSDARSALFFFQFNWPMIIPEKGGRRRMDLIRPDVSIAAPSLFRIASFMNHACEYAMNVLPSPPFPSRKVQFIAARDLKAGEELFWHYGPRSTASIMYDARCVCPKCQVDIAFELLETADREAKKELKEEGEDVDEDEDEDVDEEEEEQEQEQEEEEEDEPKDRKRSVKFFK